MSIESIEGGTYMPDANMPTIWGYYTGRTALLIFLKDLSPCLRFIHMKCFMYFNLNDNKLQ